MSARKRASKNKQAKARKRRVAKTKNSQQLREAIGWFMPTESLQDLKMHGNTKWHPAQLISLVLLWTWTVKDSLTDGFDDAYRSTRQLYGECPLTTYQGMAGAMLKWTGKLMPLLQRRLHQLIVKIGGRHARVGRWSAIAIDGSRVSTPRTKSNERAFCAANYGKGKTAKYRKKKTKGLRRKKNKQAKPEPQRPQVWVTLFWHIGLALPWCWKLGPSDSSERQHAMDMIGEGHFLKDTLFVGDAGFVGYDLWRSIIQKGHDFLIRVGGNVHLLRELGYEIERGGRRRDIVHCWPYAAQTGRLPPLTLRLVQVKIGKQQVWLLTSVLDPQELSRSEMRRLYMLRWGVELEFRGLKQTFERRRLRSRRADRALNELEWSLLAMAVLELFALKQQLDKRNADPRKASFAKSLRAIRLILKNLESRDDVDDLESLLAAAQVDRYERRKSKAARYKPQAPSKPSCGAPNIKPASDKHKQKLQRIIENELKQAA